MRFQLYRATWTLIWTIFIRPIPRSYLNGWKIFLLSLFGSNINRNSIIYSTARIYNPKNLVMDEGAVLGPDTDCYNVSRVYIGKNAIVSQKVYLCTASHDINKKTFDLISKDIIIKKNAWIAADSFIGMGITIGENAVVGARACCFKDVPDNAIVGGNPAKIIKMRKNIDRNEYED
jgi:putative colanic acid biosynthesis acetyltransferase WcaF